MGAEDGSRQRTDLAAVNKISVAVAAMRSAIWLSLAGDPAKGFASSGIAAVLQLSFIYFVEKIF